MGLYLLSKRERERENFRSTSAKKKIPLLRVCCINSTMSRWKFCKLLVKKKKKSNGFTQLEFQLCDLHLKIKRALNEILH